MSRWLRRWHRWFGLGVALLALELAVTGMLLNHTDDLHLSRQPVQNASLLSWYGVRPPAQIPAFQAGRYWVSQWGQQVFIDARPVRNPPDGRLIGAVSVQGLLALAWPDRVWLLTDTGQLVMSWDASTDLARPVAAIGSDGERIWLRTAQGVQQSDAGLMAWRAALVEVPGWAHAAPLPPILRDEITPLYLGQSLSWERVMLDLHSGRLFGATGVWIVDIAAVLLVLLAVSGLWIWWAGRRARRRVRDGGSAAR